MDGSLHAAGLQQQSLHFYVAVYSSQAQRPPAVAAGPVHVGAVVSCYCDVLETGRSSARILVEVWINAKQDGEPLKVTEGEFIYVAIDENKLTRPIPQ